MNKNKELVKNTGYLTIGKICTQFISFLLLPLYTSVLTTEEYGTVDFFNTYQQLLVYIVFLQIEQGVFRHLLETRKFQDKARQKSIISSAVGVAFASSVIFALLFALLHRLINSEYSIFLLINVLVMSFSGLVLQIARGFGDNISYVLGSFISAVATIITNVVLVGVLRVGPAGMLTAIGVGNLCCLLFLTIRCRIYRYISFKTFRKDVALELLKYSIPLVPNSLAWWVIGASDRTIVLMLLGQSFNGLLAVSHKFSNIFSSIFQIFHLSWTESASLHIEDADRSAFLTDIINKSMMLFGCLCAGIVAAMPFVFPVLIDASYAEAYYQIPLFMLAAFLNAVQGLYSVVYVALKQTKKIAYSTVAAAIINVVAGVLLIGKIGLFAAPVSSIIAYIVIIVFRYADLQKYVAVRLDWKRLIAFVALFAVTLVAYYLGGWIVQALVLLAVAAISFLLNRELLGGLLKGVLGRFHKSKN